MRGRWPRPEVLHRFEQNNRAFEVHGFVDERGRAEIAREPGVALELRTAQHEHRRHDALLLHPAQDIEAVHGGHGEIEQHNGGLGELVTIGILAAAGKIRDGFAAAVQTDEANGSMRPGKSQAHEFNVIVVVVNQ